MTTIDAGIFPAEFDDEFAVGPHEGNKAFFGRDVLRGLVEGIDDLVQVHQSRRYGRVLGPVLIGSSMWMDDPELLDSLGILLAACIVVRKERRDHHKMPRLREVARRVPGIPTRAFPELTMYAPKVDGRPLVLGPYSDEPASRIPSVRSVGFRARGETLGPIVHAKLALVGSLWWHDEGPIGNVEDVIGFTATRLWVSSANFTKASRSSLEFGYWTEDPALIGGARRFLLRLIAASEAIDAEADQLDPDLAMVEFDDEAMVEAVAEMGGFHNEEDE